MVECSHFDILALETIIKSANIGTCCKRVKAGQTLSLCSCNRLPTSPANHATKVSCQLIQLRRRAHCGGVEGSMDLDAKGAGVHVGALCRSGGKCVQLLGSCEVVRGGTCPRQGCCRKSCCGFSSNLASCIKIQAGLVFESCWTSECSCACIHCT